METQIYPLHPHQVGLIQPEPAQIAAAKHHLDLAIKEIEKTESQNQIPQTMRRLIVMVNDYILNTTTPKQNVIDVSLPKGLFDSTYQSLATRYSQSLWGAEVLIAISTGEVTLRLTRFPTPQ